MYRGELTTKKTQFITKTYNFQWQRKDLIKAEKMDLSQSIILFDYSDEIISSILSNKEFKSLHIIFVKPAESYKQVDNTHFAINPFNKEDYKLLFESLIKDNKVPSKIIYKLAKEKYNINEKVVKNQIEDGFYSLLYLSQTLMKLRIKNKIDLLFIYEGEKDSEPLYNSISGFAKTIHLENPNYKCKTINLNLGDNPNEKAIANIIINELEIEKDDIEVLYEKEKRYIKKYEEIQLDNSIDKEISFKLHGNYLITGGAGGIGRIFARYLAVNFKANIILTGSSKLNEEKNKTLQDLKKLGANAIYICADLSKRSDVELLIKEVQNKFGKIDGILHCAGFIKDGLLINKQKEDMERVFGPKIYGSIFLAEMIKNNPVDFMVFFSGLASVMGNVGQIDYSYANAFLDNFSRFLKDKLPKTKVVSVNWPLWENGGMKIDDEIKEHLEKTTGMTTIDDKDGIEIVSKALKTSFSEIVVVRADSGRKEVMNLNMNESKLSKASNNAKEGSKEVNLNKKVEDYIKNIVSKQLKLDPSRIISSEPLEKYGIDSMSIVRMTNEIEKDFGELSKTLFFEYQNVKELTDYFLDNHKDTIANKFETKEQIKEEINEVKVNKKEAKTTRRNRFIKESPISKSKALPISEEDSGDIAIIGISGRYPQAKNLDEYWENLKTGKDCITEIPSDRWDYKEYYSPKRGEKGKIYNKWGGFIDDYDKFDPFFFGITPRDAELMDPQERLFLEVTWQAVEDAGYNIHGLNKYEVGVYVGVMYGHYQLFGAEESISGNTMALSSSYSSIANRISYMFDFNGPSIALDTMCSSSITTVHLACESIRSGDCDMAIAGGVNLSIHPTKYLYLCANNFASSDGRCRSFGEGGDGYVPGEGVGALLLKSLSKAKADGDHIYAVIKGSSINHGGATNGYTVPNPNKQSELILKALKKSKVNPRAISYIEAHGTGTALGDPIEVTGLTKAFSKYTEDKQFCSIGSVKSNVGHLEAAAGIAGITKIVLQMKNKQLVPSIHSSVTNKNIKFENTPVYVQKSCEEWKQPVININGKDTKFPRIAGISAFGAGGSNAHMILEEYIDDSEVAIESSNKPEIVVLSARNEERLKEYSKRLLKFININSNSSEGNLDNSLVRIEKELSELVVDLLDINPSDLDVDSTFFELNCDMVNITAIVDKINAKFSINLTIQNVLDNPSVALVSSYLCNEYKDLIKSEDSTLNLEDIAYTLQIGREEKDVRLAIVARNTQELQNKLEEFTKGNKSISNLYIGNADRNKALSDERFSDDNIRRLIEGEEYNSLVELWVSGAKIDWNLLYKDSKPKRISLPTYPFDLKRYWYNSYEKKKVKDVEVKEIKSINIEEKKNELILQSSTYLEGYEDDIKNYNGSEVSMQIIDETIALITMNDKKNRNMFSTNLVVGLMSKFAEVERNEKLKAVILTGYDNIFCMGGMQEHLIEIANEKRSFTDVPFLYRGLLECKVPVITAIQGHASGGGFLFGLYGDMIVMSEEGIYSAVFTKYGFTPGMGATYILNKKFGENLATEMMYTAKSFTGEELYKNGASVTFKKGKDVMKEALRIAKMLSEKPLLTLKTLKAELASRTLEELPKYIERENLMHQKTFVKPEVKERIQHFYLDDHEFNTNTDEKEVENSKSSKIKLSTFKNDSHSKKSITDLKGMLEAIESGNISPEEALKLREKNNKRVLK